MSIPRVVLASDDLNARARVLAAAEPLGLDVVTVAPAGFAPQLTDAALLIIDLDRGGAAALAEFEAASKDGSLPKRVVGFFSHIDTELGNAARAVGCEPMPRGRFWAALPELLGSLV